MVVTTAMTEDPLAAFRRFFTDDRYVAPTDALLAWSLRHCACDRGTPWHARSSFYSATFAHHCAPPDATWIERTYHRRRRQAALGRLTPSNTKQS